MRMSPTFFRYVQKSFGIALLFLLTLAQSVLGQTPDPDELISVRLFSDASTIKRGDSVWLGVEIEIEKDWHIYWKTSGETGLPTEIEWTISLDAKIGPTLYPTPYFYEYQGSASYAYKEKILLLTKLNLPVEGEIPGGIISVQCDLSALVCNEFNCDIYVSYQNDQFIRANDSVIYNQFSGPHPSGLTSTHISILNPVNINKIVWTLNYQDIISFGYLLKNKILRTTKIISLAGPSVFEPSLIKARINGNIDQITAGKVDSNSRIISGSVLHGHKSDGVMNYLGFYDSQISAIPDEVNEIFMNWLMPGSNLHSKLNVFLSSFVKPKEFIFNTSIGGGNRAIVPINSYEEVIPMDILVTQLLKSLVVSDTEMAIDLGMLELVPEDLALCSYVCPSKYDYSSILMDNLNKVYSEL